jgi:Cysteine rich repeat
MIRKILATALLVFSLAGVVHAQDRKGLREACMSDAKKFCSEVQPGGGRIVQCLRSHDAELASACRDGLAAMKAAR